MKITTKLLAATVALAISGAAFAQHRGDFVGAVSPRGNGYYTAPVQHGAGFYHNGYYGGYQRDVLVVLGAVAIGAAIARPPQVVYVQAPPPPQIVYVPSDPQFRCDGAVIINGIYHCPRFAN